MDRKEIVKVLEEHFGIKAKYMGAPSFAYQIETEGDTYTIDREGRIITQEGKEIELDRLIKGSVEEEKIELTETPTLEIAIPMTDHTGATLRNLVNMIYSKQDLIKKALGLEDDIIQENFVIGINENKVETLEDFKATINNIGNSGCQGIIFNFEDNTITFRFIEGEGDAEKLKVYILLVVTMINQTAKNLKCASYKSKPTDNPKYTFRVWLLRQGMIGDEYKQVRKILLENLDGNSVFRSGKPAKSEWDI